MHNTRHRPKVDNDASTTLPRRHAVSRSIVPWECTSNSPSDNTKKGNQTREHHKRQAKQQFVRAPRTSFNTRVRQTNIHTPVLSHFRMLKTHEKKHRQESRRNDIFSRSQSKRLPRHKPSLIREQRRLVHPHFVFLPGVPMRRCVCSSRKWRAGTFTVCSSVRLVAHGCGEALDDLEVRQIFV